MARSLGDEVCLFFTGWSLYFLVSTEGRFKTKVGILERIIAPCGGVLEDMESWPT